MLARGPGTDGTTMLGVGHIEAERRLQDKIIDIHNLQFQYNRGKEEIESWSRKEKDMKQQIHDLDQQKKDAKNQSKDQMERQKIEDKRSDTAKLRARVAGEALNVQFQGQLNKKQQSLKNKELDIQLKKQ